MFCVVLFVEVEALVGVFELLVGVLGLNALLSLSTLDLDSVFLILELEGMNCLPSDIDPLCLADGAVCAFVALGVDFGVLVRLDL